MLSLLKHSVCTGNIFRQAFDKLRLTLLRISIKEPLKNAVFVIPAEAGIQDLRQKINFKVEIY